MRLLVSLAAHENEAVLLGQLRNLLQFLRDPVIVLHLSEGFEVDLDRVRTSERVLVNTERCATAWGTGILAHVHMRNVRYALERTECDYVSFHSSNELFVREGVETYIEGHAAGITPGGTRRWAWRDACRRDRPLRRYVRSHDLASPLIGQLEGSFYRRDVFEQMLARLEPLERRVAWRQLQRDDRPREGRPGLFAQPRYPREEVYFPTALAACGIRPTAAPYTYMNWGRELALSLEEVEAVRRRDYDALPGFDLSPGQELYAVKRVPRATDDPLRRHIDGLLADA